MVTWFSHLLAFSFLNLKFINAANGFLFFAEGGTPHFTLLNSRSANPCRINSFLPLLLFLVCLYFYFYSLVVITQHFASLTSISLLNSTTTVSFIACYAFLVSSSHLSSNSFNTSSPLSTTSSPSFFS